MRFFFFVFLVLAIGIILTGHLFIAKTAIHFFPLDGRIVRRLLVLFALLASVGFVFLSAATRFVDLGAVRYAYAAASFWLGAVWYLALACALLWILWFAAGSEVSSFYWKLIAGAFFLLAFMVAGIGAVNARHVRVTEITVAIKNLPDYWRDRTAVLLTDIHLGAIIRPEFFDTVAARIKDLRPDIILLGGDYFDGSCPDPAALAAPLKNLEAPHGVLMVDGNHETYEGIGRILKAVKPYTQVRYLRNERVTIEGLQFVGAAYPEPGKPVDWGEAFTGVDPDEPIVFLFHEPKGIPEAQARGVDLMLSGHTHRGQMWPFGGITELIYGKYHSGRHEADGFTIYTSTGLGTWGPPIRLASPPEIVRITFLRR